MLRTTARRIWHAPPTVHRALRALGVSLTLAVLCGAFFLGAGGAAGCRGSNPVATAATAAPENRAETIAFALHNSYVVVAEAAATIAENDTTPVAVKRILVELNDRASPAAKSLREAAEHYNQVREAVAAGQSTGEKLQAALTELNQVITEAAPKIDALARVVSGQAPRAGGES